MKKYLIALFALAPVLCFGDSSEFVPNRLYTFLWTGPNKYTTISGSDYFTKLDGEYGVYSVLFNHRFAIGFNQRDTSHNRYLAFPSQSTLYDLSLNTYSKATVAFPIHGTSNGVNCCYSPFVYPSVSRLLTASSSLFASGYRGPGFTEIFTSNLTSYVNVDFKLLISDVLSSTNNTYQSIVLDCLNNIHSSLSGINTSINNINVDLGQFQNDYSFVNSSQLNISNVIDFAEADSIIPSRLASSLKSMARDSSNLGYINSVLDSYRAAQWLPLAFSDSDLASPLSNDSRVKRGLQNIGDSFGAGAAGHYTTPLTNELRRMSNDWVNETKAALSNNTQKIKDDLAAWKNQLHGTQTSIDNSAANINNTLNNIAGGSSVVRVNVQNQDIGVTITDPVTIDPTQFNAFSEDLGKAGDYMERLFNEFKWLAWDSPDSWKKGFLDRDLSRLSSNVQDQVSIQHSISNLLADFALNYTNNAQFAISNALAGFTFSSTNDYLLLSDYQSFIDSSKYKDVVSSLPDDLAAALSSFGFSDSSEYSGRWWVFQSANLALQSQLALTNAALSSTLLNALSAIDDSDDSGGSLLSRWLSLIDSIPDPEEIQQSLSDATNIVSNIGFERADALYATATQDLVSVVKGIYRDKSLPDNIRFVFIPAANGREEKFVDIPVGDHSSLWSLFRSGIAFALSVVTLLLFPKYVSWLVSHYTRLVERIIKSLHAYTHQ